MNVFVLLLHTLVSVASINFSAEDFATQTWLCRLPNSLKKAPYLNDQETYGLIKLSPNESLNQKTDC